jgi:hypothetical protein
MTSPIVRCQLSMASSSFATDDGLRTTDVFDRSALEIVQRESGTIAGDPYQDKGKP